MRLTAFHRHCRLGLRYSNGVYTTLSDPSSPNNTWATGINDSGQVVGLAGDSSFVYFDGVYYAVDVPTASSTQAYGINDAGEIVGIFSYTRASESGFLAVPNPNTEPDRTHVQADHTVSANAAHGVLANDTDPVLDDTLSVSAVNGQASDVGHPIFGNYGMLTLNANGSYSYSASHGGVPVLGVGIDTFSYTAADEVGGTATSTLTIVITGPGEIYAGGTAGSTIKGGLGFYVLDGGDGNDTLVAGLGAQTLIGGPGDTLTGALGIDTFVFAPSFGMNTITNFNPIFDRIELPKSEFTKFADVQSHMQQVGANT